MVSEPPPRPSTPPERRSSPPPALMARALGEANGLDPHAGALRDEQPGDETPGDEGPRVEEHEEGAAGERISVEPGSRPGMLPPKASVPPPSAEPASPASSTSPISTGPVVADRAPAAPKATGSRPTPMGRGPSNTIRMSAARLSIDGGRKTRLSVLRESILSRLPSIPISRIAQSGPLSILALVLLGAVAVVVVMWSTGRMPAGLASVLHLQQKNANAITPPPLPSIEVAVDENPFPELRRGRAPMSGGVLYIPSSFTARADGAFDLVIHFHGNTELVTESYETSQLDAVVAVLNLGTGSGRYEERFENPAALAEVLARTTDSLAERGLPHPKLRRLALVGWSAGYGAVVRILEHPDDADRVDAVLLLDGLHVSYREGTHDVEEAKIAGVIRYAERAKRGEKLFLVNHSDIEPQGYLGVHETVDFLLGRIGVERKPAEGTTTLPHLVSMEGVLPKDELKPLVLTSEAIGGGVVVHGYAGNDKATHIEHLVQMSQLALPVLQKRWQ